eukprot:14534906-Alexandrium_andersonii.AAC.1
MPPEIQCCKVHRLADSWLDAGASELGSAARRHSQTQRRTNDEPEANAVQNRQAATTTLLNGDVGRAGQGTQQGMAGYSR